MPENITAEMDRKYLELIDKEGLRKFLSKKDGRLFTEEGKRVLGKYSDLTLIKDEHIAFLDYLDLMEYITFSVNFDEMEAYAKLTESGAKRLKKELWNELVEN